MTKRKDLSKALDQVENSKGTHHAIDFKPGPRTAMVESLMSLSRLMILYIDLRQEVKELMTLHDFRQEPDTDIHPSGSDWFEALMRVDAAMNALRDFEAGMAGGPKTEFPSGVVSFDVGTEPSNTVVVSRDALGTIRDEVGHTIDTPEKYKEWKDRHKEVIEPIEAKIMEDLRDLKPGESVESHDARKKQYQSILPSPAQAIFNCDNCGASITGYLPILDDEDRSCQVCKNGTLQLVASTR